MKSVVFLHGILGDERTWQPAFNYLPDNFQAYSYTLSTEQFDTSHHADELIEFCHSLKQGKVMVVAWSYSCHIALLAALKAPELFESIHLYDCIVPSYGLENDPENYRLFSKDLQKMMMPVIKALKVKDEQLALECFVEACSTQGLTFAQQSSNIQAIKRDNNQTVAQLLAQKTPENITAEMLQTLTVPCGIHWGEYSRPIFKLASTALFNHLSAEIRIKNSGEIPKVDHLLPEESPNLFIQHIFNDCSV